VRLGEVRLAFLGRDAGSGILGWSLLGIASTELDGLPTSGSPQELRVHAQEVEAPPIAQEVEAPPIQALHAQVHAHEHPNGVVAIDHLVAMSPELDRAVQALQVAGLDLRRIREQPTPAGAPRQAFFRIGQVILEVVQEPAEIVERAEGSPGPTRFWGLALLSDDLELTVERLGQHCGEIRAAVQPGRRIATMRRSAGLAVPVALMSRGDR